MIKAIGPVSTNKIKPYLIAVHISADEPEFKNVAKLWARKELFSGQMVVTNNAWPNPFKGKVHEIHSLQGDFRPDQIPLAIRTPSFVIVGGSLLSCLRSTFISLFEAGDAFYGRVQIAIPLNCAYLGPFYPQASLAEKRDFVKNDGYRYELPLNYSFGGKYQINFDNKMVCGGKDFLARVDWFSTAQKLIKYLNI